MKKAFELGVYPRLLGLFGAFWGKVWTLGAKVWDPIMRVQEHWGLGCCRDSRLEFSPASFLCSNPKYPIQLLLTPSLKSLKASFNLGSGFSGLSLDIQNDGSEELAMPAYNPLPQEGPV